MNNSNLLLPQAEEVVDFTFEDNVQLTADVCHWLEQGRHALRGFSIGLLRIMPLGTHPAHAGAGPSLADLYPAVTFTGDALSCN